MKIGIDLFVVLCFVLGREVNTVNWLKMNVCISLLLFLSHLFLFLI